MPFRTAFDSPKQEGWSFSWGTGPRVGVTGSNDEDADEAAKELGFENANALNEAVNHALMAWLPRVMFVLLPLFAWFVARGLSSCGSQLPSPFDFCAPRSRRVLHRGGSCHAGNARFKAAWHSRVGCGNSVHDDVRDSCVSRRLRKGASFVRANRVLSCSCTGSSPSSLLSRSWCLWSWARSSKD